MFEKMFELKLHDISTYSSTIKRGICHWLCLIDVLHQAVDAVQSFPFTKVIKQT